MIIGAEGIYALTLSGLLATSFALTHLLPRILRFRGPILLFTTKTLSYTFVLGRHAWVGPWTVAATVAQSMYIIGNIISISLGVSSLSEVALRAGKMALVNLIPLFLSPHLGTLADFFGISLRSFRKVHGSVGVMSFVLTLVHVCIMLFQSEQRDLYTLMVVLLSTLQVCFHPC
jgi:hypothetical protein